MTGVDWIAFLVLISAFLIGAGIACVGPSASGPASASGTLRRHGPHRLTRARLNHGSGAARAVRHPLQSRHRRRSVPGHWATHPVAGPHLR